MSDQSVPVLVEEPVEIAVETLNDSQVSGDNQTHNNNQNLDNEQASGDNRTSLDRQMTSMAATTGKLLERANKRLDTILLWTFALTLGPVVEAVRMFARYLKRSQFVRHARTRGRQAAHVTVITIPRVVLFFLLCCVGFIEYLAVGSWGLIAAAVAGGIVVVTTSIRQCRSDS